METGTILKTDEFKKLLRQVVQEQMSETYLDMDEIRRSPAASIIRIEEEIKSIKQNMATKEELRALEGRVEGKFNKLERKFVEFDGKFEALEGKFDGKFEALDGKIDALDSKFESKFEALEGKFDGKFDGLDGRLRGVESKMSLLIALVIAMFALYGGLIVKLVFFP